MAWGGDTPSRASGAIFPKSPRREAHCPSAGIPKSAAECGGLKTAQDGQRLVPGADPVLRTDPLRSEVSATGTGTAFQTCLSPPAYRDSSHAALSPSSVPTL